MAWPGQSIGDFEIYGPQPTYVEPCVPTRGPPIRAEPSRTWQRIFHMLGLKKEQAIRIVDEAARKKALGRAENQIFQFRNIYEQHAGLPDGENWQPDRPLGAGGFGAVASYVHYDQTGQKTDCVVIKTATAMQACAAPGFPIALSREAAIMYQTNRLRSENIVRLRNFKYRQAQQEWRFYLEYCPYGDLERLRLRYRAKKQYLPETFLWHLFRSLVRGAWVMETGPFNYYTVAHAWIEAGYLVHCDLKPSNILLGGSEPKEGTEEMFRFPMPKIADFGLAKLTSWNDHGNNAREFKAGTPAWYPPEIRYGKLVQDAVWYPFEASIDGTAAEIQHRLQYDPEFQQMYREKRAHRITPAASIWVIGAIMYQMITLDDFEPVDDATDKQLTWGDYFGFSSTRNKDGSVMPEFETLKEVVAQPEFSDKLKQLVSACLHLRPENRPSAEDLLPEIDAGLQQAMEDLKEEVRTSLNPAFVIHANRVKCIENEINELPQGCYPLRTDAEFWRDFDKYEMWTPNDWPMLRVLRVINSPTSSVMGGKGEQIAAKRSLDTGSGSGTEIMPYPEGETSYPDQSESMRKRRRVDNGIPEGATAQVDPVGRPALAGFGRVMDRAARDRRDSSHRGRSGLPGYDMARNLRKPKGQPASLRVLRGGPGQRKNVGPGHRRNEVIN